MENDPNNPEEKKNEENKKTEPQKSEEDGKGIGDRIFAGPEAENEGGGKTEFGEEGEIKLGGDVDHVSDGEDTIFGGEGQEPVDILIVDLTEGSSVISLSGNHETLVTGDGKDVIIIGKDGGHDVITDFDIENDTLDLFDLGFNSFEEVINAAKEVGDLLTGNDGVVIDLGDGNSITLDGLSLEDLSKANIDLF
jgi:hypothetical protein